MGDGARAGRNAARTVGHHCSGEVTSAALGISSHTTRRASRARHRAVAAPSEGAVIVRLCPSFSSRAPRAAKAISSAVEPLVESLEGRRMFAATPLNVHRTLTDTPPSASETFGDTMATLGDRIVVGLPG